MNLSPQWRDRLYRFIYWLLFFAFWVAGSVYHAHHQPPAHYHLFTPYPR